MSIEVVTREDSVRNFKLWACRVLAADMLSAKRMGADSDNITSAANRVVRHALEGLQGKPERGPWKAHDDPSQAAMEKLFALKLAYAIDYYECTCVGCQPMVPGGDA